MTFIQRALADKPLGLWELDDLTPYQDYSGYGRTATFTGTEVKHPSLVSGAVYSVIVDRDDKITFDSPVFVRGRENEAFTLETWVRPTYRTEGYEPLTYRENLLPNPSAEGGYAWASNNNALYSATDDTTTYVVGTKSRKSTLIGTTSTVLSFYGLGHTYSHLVSPTNNPRCTAGKTYTLSVALRAGQAGYRGNCSISWTDDAGNSVAPTTVTGTYVTLTAGVWTRVSVTGVAPVGATNIRCSTNVNTVSGANGTIGDFANADAACLVEGTYVGYFDGSMPGYEWAGTVNQSISRTVDYISRINYALNSAFNLDTNADGLADSWWAYEAAVENTGTVTRTNVTTGAVTGKGQRIAATALVPGSGNRVGIGQTITTIKPDTTYTISATFNSNTPLPAGMRYSIYVDVANSASGLVNSSSQYFTTPGRKTNTFTTLSGANRATLYLWVAGDSATAPAAVDFTVDEVLIEESATANSYFDGSYMGAAWSGTTDASYSYMLTSKGEQQILGNTATYDGLTIDGSEVSFVTKYTATGESRASFELDDLRNIHLVGVHTRTANFLYIDGELVADSSISDAQQADTFASSATSLVSGESNYSQFFAMNGVAIYATALNVDTIKEHFSAGRPSLQNQAVGIYGGENIYLSKQYADVMFDMEWTTEEDWLMAQFDNVGVQDGALVPQLDSTGALVAGTWKDSVDLYNFGTASAIYGAIMDWDGEDVSVRASLDGTTWVAVERHTNISILPDGYIPTNKELFIEVSFTDADGFMSEMNITAFKSKNFTVSGLRDAASFGGVHIMNEYPEIEMRDDWGVRLELGGIDIPVEPGAVAGIQTIEIWARNLTAKSASNQYLLDTRDVSNAAKNYVYRSATALDNGNWSSGNNVTYLDGVAAGSLAWGLGEWSVLHFTMSTSQNPTSIHISEAYNSTGRGTFQIGKVVIYDRQLTATEVAEIYQGYTSSKTLLAADTSAITVSESATSASVYARDWSIVASAQ